jgi:hypothetical protein
VAAQVAGGELDPFTAADQLVGTLTSDSDAAP